MYAVSCWPFLLLAYVVAARADRARLRRLIWAVAISGLAGLVSIAAFPVAPPRLTGALEDQVAGSPITSLAHPSGWFHPYAAMPSFHVTWTSLAAAGMRPRLSRAAWLMPIAMSLAVITTGNHWVLDVVAGWLLAATAWRMAPLLHRRAVRGLARHERFARLRQDDPCAPGST